MSKFSSRRPSPALVISILALFVALGGSAYAATKIGTKDIKANAITTGKIKKNAITTAKIKKEAVTGAKIKESSLGAVPNATNAVNATNFSRFFTTGIRKASPSQTLVLATAGPFTFTGKCIDAGGGVYAARQFVTTSQPNSAVDSTNEELYEFDFQPGTEVELGYGPQQLTPYLYTELEEASWSVVSADGATFLQGYAYSGVHALGAACIFNLNWTNVS